MKTRMLSLLAVALILTMSCSKDDKVINPTANVDYSLKVYALERSPKINRVGAGMDFIHAADGADTTYFGPSMSDDFIADAVFFNLMVYFVDENGDTQSEGSPAILLGENVSAAEIGAGVDFFAELTTITDDMLDALIYEESLDFDACKNVNGMYDRDMVMTAYDKCVIGNKFRGRVLEAPEGSVEQDVQPVFLIKTADGAYVKFMVKQFKGDGADKQKTIVQWQALSL